MNNAAGMQIAGAGRKQLSNGAINTLLKEDLPIHGWYRFVLSFPPHLVRQYIERLRLTNADLLLDPFCGTGTLLTTIFAGIVELRSGGGVAES